MSVYIYIYHLCPRGKLKPRQLGTFVHNQTLSLSSKNLSALYTAFIYFCLNSFSKDRQIRHIHHIQHAWFQIKVLIKIITILHPPSLSLISLCLLAVWCLYFDIELVLFVDLGFSILGIRIIHPHFFLGASLHQSFVEGTLSSLRLIERPSFLLETPPIHPTRYIFIYIVARWWVVLTVAYGEYLFIFKFISFELDFLTFQLCLRNLKKVNRSIWDFSRN